MSLLSKIQSMLAISNKSLHKIDAVVDVVLDMAAAAEGVPVEKNGDGNLVEVTPAGNAVDIDALEKRIAALEKKAKPKPKPKPKK